ncbi:hypothetical protein OF83DRAFT_1153192, partial [Amylostereum chailletii]
METHVDSTVSVTVGGSVIEVKINTGKKPLNAFLLFRQTRPFMTQKKETRNQWSTRTGREWGALSSERQIQFADGARELKLLWLALCRKYNKITLEKFQADGKFKKDTKGHPPMRHKETRREALVQATSQTVSSSTSPSPGPIRQPKTRRARQEIASSPYASSSSSTSILTPSTPIDYTNSLAAIPMKILGLGAASVSTARVQARQSRGRISSELQMTPSYHHHPGQLIGDHSYFPNTPFDFTQTQKSAQQVQQLYESNPIFTADADTAVSTIIHARQDFQIPQPEYHNRYESALTYDDKELFRDVYTGHVHTLPSQGFM